MIGKTNIQIVIERQRAIYEREGAPPFLQQATQVYRITIREFAGIFGISKAYAEDIIKHRKFPTLEIAIRMSRFFGCTVEELFGWRVNDDGKRRPLIKQDRKTGKMFRLIENKKEHTTVELVKQSIEEQAEEKGLQQQGESC